MPKVQDPVLEQAKTEARFWSKVNKTEGCWLWLGTTSKGYGQFWVNGHMVQAHRFAYELLVGSIPEGLDLDHLCRIRQCVFPVHTEPVTNRQNILRGEGIAAQRFYSALCSRGHPFNAANTHIAKNGIRRCRVCRRERQTIRRSLWTVVKGRTRNA